MTDYSLDRAGHPICPGRFAWFARRSGTRVVLVAVKIISLSDTGIEIRSLSPWGRVNSKTGVSTNPDHFICIDSDALPKKEALAFKQAGLL